MPRQTPQVDDFEEFVRQSFSPSRRASSNFSDQSSTGSCSRTPPEREDSSPVSSPESLYPNDAEVMLGLTPSSVTAKCPGSPYRGHLQRRGSTTSCAGGGGGGALTEANLERHTRMFESRLGRSPHPTHRVDVQEQRRSMTPSPRHRLHQPLSLTFSAISPGPMRRARRPCELELRRVTSRSPDLNGRTRIICDGDSDDGCREADDGEGIVYRSFSTSSKGIINRGDCLRFGRGGAACGVRQADNKVDGTSELDNRQLARLSNHSSQPLLWPGPGSSGSPTFNVLVLGASGVGKTSLSQQFTTSEYMGYVDLVSDESGLSRRVNVMLDGNEACVKVTDMSSDKDYLWYDDVDAYVIVYSVSDLRSFQHAATLLEDIRHDLSRQTAIILVANKSDIVRNRVVSDSDGRRLATKFDCKYIAVSAVLNHRVDELLVGVISQIRLIQKRSQKLTVADCGWMLKASRGLSRVLGKHPLQFRSCDNLLVL